MWCKAGLDAGAALAAEQPAARQAIRHCLRLGMRSLIAGPEEI
jgi:hypothetical protein